jgi:hypothetical protein
MSSSGNIALQAYGAARRAHPLPFRDFLAGSDIGEAAQRGREPLTANRLPANERPSRDMRTKAARPERMPYRVIELFKPGKLPEVYRCYAERGRLAPAGLTYVDSWIAEDLRTCYQLMEAERFELFAEWTRHWDDLVDFEIARVLTSAQARERVLGPS